MESRQYISVQAQGVTGVPGKAEGSRNVADIVAAINSTDRVTVGRFLGTLQLRHLETVLLRLSRPQRAVGHVFDSVPVSDADSVYFELSRPTRGNNADSISDDSMIFRSEAVHLNPSSSWDGLLSWGSDAGCSGDARSLALTLRGSPVANPARRLTRFSVAFYRVGGSGGGRELLLRLHSLDLSRDLSPLKWPRDITAADPRNSEWRLLAALEDSAASVALRLKGIYFVARRCLPGIELATYSDAPGVRDSYGMLTLRQLLATSVKSIDLEIASARLRRQVAAAGAPIISGRWRLEKLRRLSELKRLALAEQLESLTECRSRLQQLRTESESLADGLAELHQAMEVDLARAQEAESNLGRDREELAATRAELGCLRRQLLAELVEIFAPTDCGVAGVPMPLAGLPVDGGRMKRQEAAKCSACLGLAAQLLLLTASIVDCPLRHAVMLRGSKSRVRDNLIRKFAKPDFPLYHRPGKELAYFTRGGFLLNLNVYGLACNVGAPLPANLRAGATTQNLRHLLDFLIEARDEQDAVATHAHEPEVVGSSPPRLNIVNVAAAAAAALFSRSVDGLRVDSGRDNGGVSPLARSA